MEQGAVWLIVLKVVARLLKALLGVFGSKRKRREELRKPSLEELEGRAAGKLVGEPFEEVERDSSSESGEVFHSIEES